MGNVSKKQEIKYMNGFRNSPHQRLKNILLAGLFTKMRKYLDTIAFIDLINK